MNEPNKDPLGLGSKNKKKVHLKTEKDLFPTPEEVSDATIRQKRLIYIIAYAGVYVMPFALRFLSTRMDLSSLGLIPLAVQVVLWIYLPFATYRLAKTLGMKSNAWDVTYVAFLPLFNIVVLVVLLRRCAAVLGSRVTPAAS